MITKNRNNESSPTSPSDAIIAKLKVFEGYLPIAKQLKGDRKDVITGGHGTIVHPDGRAVKVGDVFSEEYADYCLRVEVTIKCKRLITILSSYSLVVNQNQFDALCSFAYNLGTGFLCKGHSLGDALAAHDMHAAARAILLYNKGTEYFLGIPRKVVLKGLDTRRKEERKLFES